MIKVKQTITQEVEREIPARSFYKVGSLSAVIAVIDEENIYRCFFNSGYTSIQNGTDLEMKTDLSYCIPENEITEEEFIEVYEKARKATDLTPYLSKVVTAKEGSEVRIR